MALIVQKYGGSSLADADKIRNAANRIATTQDKGNQVVVVVSAMGDTTDRLTKTGASGLGQARRARVRLAAVNRRAGIMHPDGYDSPRYGARSRQPERGAGWNTHRQQLRQGQNSGHRATAGSGTNWARATSSLSPGSRALPMTRIRQLWGEADQTPPR